jgi:hypothetical protein
MRQPLYTDREGHRKPPTTETIGSVVWGGVCALVSARRADNSLGQRFPDNCPDGYGICGYNDEMLRLALAAEIPQMEWYWPLDWFSVPETPIILDLLEFIATSVGKPTKARLPFVFPS